MDFENKFQSLDPRGVSGYDENGIMTVEADGMLFQRKKLRKRFRFYGEVQAVGFRFTAAAAAEEYGATGWVKNEADESVSMELQGSEKQLRRVLDALNQNDYIRIDRMESEPLAVIPKERKFEIKF